MLGRLRGIGHNLAYGLKLAWTASPRALVFYTALGMIGAAMPPATVLLSATLVTRIVAARAASQPFSELFPILFLLLVSTTIHRTVGAHLTHGRNLFVRRVQFEAEGRLVAQAARVDLGHFDSADWHDRLARAKRDVSWRPGDLTWSVLLLSGQIVTLALMTTLLATMHWIMVALAVVAAASSLVLERGVASRLYQFFYNSTAADREREYLGDLLVQPRTAKEIRAYVLADHLTERHRRLSERLMSEREQMHRMAIRSSLVTGVVNGVTISLAYALAAAQGVAGSIEPGGVVLVMGAFSVVSGTLGQLTSTLVAVDQHTAFLDDYISFLAIRPLLPVASMPRPIPAELTDGIQFDRVSFTYAGASRPSVADLRLHIKKGELIALVGDNGAGKTTLVKLLLRFYDASRGAVRVGGVDVKDADPEALRQRIGVLFQDYAGYELTVRDNVTMGRPGGDIDDGRVIAALRQSRSDALVGKLRHGLDTKVGRLFEGAHDLSGGEWQRLALARLIYRDADVWVLDEPTAALDPEAEAAIFAELKANLEGRIGIVISHRFSTARVADRIAVIADGRIAELGTHHELLSANGRYASLFELQAAGYR
jgi:ATP-binding cassette, subfamily B, bacterial